ncbi:MAG TPA: NUDIX domain-containing protein [Anaerolineales bacterium]|nr:NUDIX domain-containing protein [Anaerolineales bacterium]
MPIELKAMVLIRNNGDLLVSKGFDEIKQSFFYRLLGGHVEFFETAEQAVRREIMEEIGSELENLKLIGVIENLFTYQGKRGHEIDYLFSGRLTLAELLKQRRFRLQEDDGEFWAEWVAAVEIFSGSIPLYPPYDYQAHLEGKGA